MVVSRNRRFLTYPLGHFYSPVPDWAKISARRDMAFGRAYGTVPGIDVNASKQLELLHSFSAFYHEMPFGATRTATHRYFLDNSFFSYGDGIVLYSMLRHFRPSRVVEVGSGYSSALMLDVDEMFLGRSTQFCFVEPYTDRLMSLLTAEDEQRVRIERRRVQDVEFGIFESLQANDILFIDSSHVAKFGSDVLWMMSEVTPRLRSGVLIHFHDVLWPFEYPFDWFEEGRAWNEAYFVRAFLQFNEAFEILFFNSFLELHCRSAVEAALPRAMQSPTSRLTPGNSSLWLRRV